MVAIATRASWGARYRDGDITVSGLANEVFLHHTVTTQLSASATVAQEQAQMRNIEAIGQSRFRYGISYNVIIFPSGRAYQGVSWNRRGTHTGGRNSTARSICFAGNYETNRPTEAQLQTAGAILREGRNKWWTKNAPLRSHRDVSQTACPGENVHAARPYILSLSQENIMALSDSDIARSTSHLLNYKNPETRPSVYALLIQAAGNPWAFKNEKLETRDTYAILRGIDRAVQELKVQLAAQNAQITNLVGAVSALAGGETFDEKKLLAGINATTRAAVMEVVGEALEFDVTVSPKS